MSKRNFKFMSSIKILAFLCTFLQVVGLLDAIIEQKRSYFVLTDNSKSLGNGFGILQRGYRSIDVQEANMTKSFKSDVLRVPQEELEKAIKAYENMSRTSEEDSEDSLMQTLADKASSKKVVDIAVFADVYLYDAWEKRYPKNGLKQLKEYIAAVLKNMNLLYDQKSLGMPIAFRLVYQEFQKSLPKEVDTHNGNGEAYLKSFCTYAGNKNTKGEEWDHALLLTGLDIADADGNGLVLGLAWFGTMCLNYWSCSISEAKSFSSATILTHEIGHSLGIQHDGTESCTSCDGNTNIMSPTTGKGKLTWSTCSAKNVKDFTTTGIAGGTLKGSIPTCLTKDSARGKGKKVQTGSKLPGELYDAKLQCKLHCGDTCQVHPDEEICSMLRCQKTYSSTQNMVTDAHPPLEGTSCGSGKYCRYGKCVKIPTSKPKSKKASKSV